HVFAPDLAGADFRDHALVDAFRPLVELAPVAPELLAQAAEMLGNTDVRKSREVKQALLAEARVGGGKDKGGKKGKVVPAGKSAKGKAKGGKPAAAAKPGKPTKHRKGPSKPKADNAPAATGARKRKAKS
ncbi:ribonuclease R, partial [Pseudomonas aeruginosa]